MLLDEQRDRLLRTLGYGLTPILLEPQLTQYLSPLESRPALVEEIGLLLDAIESLNGLLSAARTDSMAVEVGGIKIDYVQHVRHLKSEGSRLLRQLEALTGLPLKFDQFKGSAPRSSSNSSVSYW
ncbi:MAG: hypothetical protein KME10_17985 [Plectolyngbya sp. WJT66-NPBG17]|jgi:NTP pyrophosphatase (non-canonical NTP hydrolase)|nr:hypothetical protein [Plectolyngbya sp. WJT66-NPBG17]